MNPTSLDTIQQIIDQGDKARARKLLKPILRDNPTADAWYIAALAMETDDQKIKCLRQALTIDEFHSPANRLLHKTEGALPRHEQEKLKELERKKRETQSIQPLDKIERQMKKDRFQKHRERQKRWTRFGCLFSFLLSLSCTMFAFSAIGMLPGFIGTVSSLIGGPAPVYEIEGTPIEMRPDAPLIMTPSQSDRASDQSMDIMDHGLLHEYKFNVFAGKNYAIYVQFLSVSANRVSRNVVIVNSEGVEVTYDCEQERILDGDNGVAYVCFGNVGGEWAVRILGRQGESIGAYFVGVQALDF